MADLARSSLRRLLGHPVRALLGMAGYRLVPVRDRVGPYIDARETISAATARGLSVCEYVEELWDQRGVTDRVIAELKKNGSLSHTDRVCEIGPGTGRYLERVIREVGPHTYDIYEIADDWAEWLSKTYSPPVVRQPADGHTLSHTPSGSCGLVHAHGVFVSLPLLHAFEYFAEMARVCAPGGYVAFDIFLPSQFSASRIRKWLASPHRYPVLLPIDGIEAFFAEHDFRPVHRFDSRHGEGFSTYLVFQKQGAGGDTDRVSGH